MYLIIQGKAFRLIFCCVLAVSIIFSGFSGVSYGAAAQTALPAFTVTLNGKVIDNQTRKYPLIVYKDITYVPMTWYDCRFLGLETDWDSKTGLRISRTGVAGGYYDDLAASKNRGLYTASVPSFAVTVNGKAVNNGAEQYPLLTFRDVTYFPLTWRFAVDEFGWSYDFSASGGLVIGSAAENGRSERMDSMTINLPLVMHGDYPGACAVAGDYVYYEGKDGKIYCAPLSDPTKAKQVYQLPADSGYGSDGYPMAGLQAKNGRVWLNYHTGGATMGSDHQFLLNSGGAAQETVPYVTDFGDAMIRVSGYGIPVSDNLEIQEKDDADFRTIGDPELHHSRGAAWNGGFVYTAAISAASMYSADGYCIYRTDAKTGKSEKVLEDPLFTIAAIPFFIDDSRLLFLGADHLLRQADLSGRNVKTLTEKPINTFAIFGKDIYYWEMESGELTRLSDGKALNPGAVVSAIDIRDDYLWCGFLPGQGYYRMIFDRQGNAVYQSGDAGDKVMIYENKLIYVNIV
ncbi:MAG: hypothetical protein LBT34_02960 [Clostridiales Family XIII bacterium]|nr:hypothetical protein [Clostridiales Family XIII bacterium]